MLYNLEEIYTHVSEWLTKLELIYEIYGESCTDHHPNIHNRTISTRMPLDPSIFDPKLIEDIRYLVTLTFDTGSYSQVLNGSTSDFTSVDEKPIFQYSRSSFQEWNDNCVRDSQAATFLRRYFYLLDLKHVRGSLALQFNRRTITYQAFINCLCKGAT